jgi:hypothetical protein
VDSSKLGNWLQLLGNLGLIIGLILVAVQIKQNTDISRAQLLSDSISSSQTLDLALIGENPALIWAKAQTDPEELTDEELGVLLAFLNHFWKNIAREEELAGLGLQVSSPESRALSFLVGPYGIGDVFGQAWWDFNGDRFGSAAPRTRDAVNAILERGDRDHQNYKARTLASIKEQIAKRTAK